MRFLVDQCLSPQVAEALATNGHDAVHLRDLGMMRAKDPDVLALARAEQRVLLSADTDFGTLLAQSGEPLPSVIILRRGTGRLPLRQATLVLANLPALQEALEQGSIVVIEDDRLRVRRLPISDR